MKRKTAQREWKKQYTEEEIKEYKEKKQQEEKRDLSFIAGLLMATFEEVIAMGEAYARRYLQNWHSVKPYNVLNGREYNGFNRMYLSALGIKRTITPNQLENQNKKMFGEVDTSRYYKAKEGAKLYPIFKYGLSNYWYKELNTETGEEEWKKGHKRFFKGWYVYDIRDIEGYPIPTDDEQPRNNDPDIDLAEWVLSAWNEIVPIKYGYDGACYIPKLDEIHLPDKRDFDDIAEFYCAAFHEVTHSVAKRLRLPTNTNARSLNYARDECRAEMGGIIWSEILGISAKVFDNSVAYIRWWIKYLKDDPQVLQWAYDKAEDSVQIVVDNYNEKRKEGQPKIVLTFAWYPKEDAEKEEEEKPKKKTVSEKPKEEEPKKVEPVVEFDEKKNLVTMDVETYKKMMATLASIIG